MTKKIISLTLAVILIAGTAIVMADTTVEDIVATINKTLKITLDGKDYDAQVITYNDELYIPISALKDLTDQNFVYDEEQNKLAVGTDGTKHLIDSNFLDNCLGNMYFSSQGTGTSITSSTKDKYKEYSVSLDFYQDVVMVGGTFVNKSSTDLPVNIKQSEGGNIAYYLVPANDILVWELDISDLEDQEIRISQDSGDRDYASLTGDFSIENLYYTEKAKSPIPKDLNSLKAGAVLCTMKDFDAKHLDVYNMTFESNIKWNDMLFESALLTKADNLGLDDYTDYSTIVKTKNLSEIGGVLKFDKLESHQKYVTVYIKANDGSVLKRIELVRGVPVAFSVDVSKVDEVEIVLASDDRDNSIISGYSIYNLYKVGK